MNRRIILVPIVIGLIFVLVTDAHACSCGCAPLGNYGIGGPIITTPAYTLPQNKFVINTSLRYQNVNQLTGADFSRVSGMHAHSHDSEMQLTAAIAYGITDDLTLSISYPYRLLYGIKTHEEDNSIIDGGNAIGLGDMTLLAKYRFLGGGENPCKDGCGVESCSNNHLQAALLAGIKMPTGQTNERDSDGFRLGADEQPGTGSWDPVMGLAFSLPVNNFSFDASVTYRLSTQGIQQTTVGDTVNFNSAITYNFESYKVLGQNIQPAAVLEMNGIWQERVEYQGVKDNGHGGLVMFLSPGLRAAVNDYTVANFLIGFPIISDLNGTQPDTGIQLFAGLSRIF